MALRRLNADPDPPDGGSLGRANATTTASVGLAGRTDVEIMAGVARGEEGCLSELQRRYRDMVVSYAAAILDPDMAEDVAQEVFLRVTAHASRWQPVGPLRSYLLHIARNIALNERRRLKNTAATLNAARAFLARKKTPTPDEVLDGGELRKVILAALDAMPERRRDAFGLVRFGGLSYVDAAAVMGISPQTVANQMSAAMADLRRAIALLSEEAGLTGNSSPE